MPVITVPRPIREKLGDDGADALVALLNQASESTRIDVIVLVEEKFERRLTEEIAKLRIEFRDEIAKLRVELHNTIVTGDSALRVEMARMRADLMRWMFIFWLGQLATLIGIALAFFRR